MKAIFKREFASYFTSPLGYVMLAIYGFLSGIFTLIYYYGSGFGYGIAAAVAPMLYFAFFVIPPITMKSFTDEKRYHTDQALLTAPVKLVDIVLGKYLSAFLLYILCTLFYFVYTLFTLMIIPGAAVEWGMLFTGWLGMVLLGAAMLSINLLYSALTDSQILAVVIGLGTGLFIMLYDTLMEYLQSALSTMFSVDYEMVILDKLSITGHYRSFTSGILNPVDIVFFLSFIVLFLFLCDRVLDKKRWA